MAASVSASPAYNFPLSLYGLLVVQKTETEGGGDSVRQFAGLLGASFILDLFWFMSESRGHASTFGMLCILANLVLKPITFLALLGHLRQRGEPTFAFGGAGGFSLPSSFPGSFPPRPSETVWQAPARGGYHGGYPDEEDELEAPLPHAPRAPSASAKPPPAPPAAGEGAGYHSLE